MHFAVVVCVFLCLLSGAQGGLDDEENDPFKAQNCGNINLPFEEFSLGSSLGEILSKKKVLENSTQEPPECLGCMAGVYLMQYYIKKNKSEPEIVQLLEKRCIAYKFGDPVFCKAYSRLFGNTIVSILRKTRNSAREVCSFVSNLSCGNGDVRGHRWTLELPDNKPPIVKRKRPKSKTPKLRVLHLADTHYDPLYLEGARDSCPMWLCCRAANGMAKGDEPAAGEWGGWKCDIPEKTFDSFFAHVKETHPKIDYILWTGDIPAHAIWQQTKKEALEMMKATNNKILENFPDTPVYPAVGNHEGSPPDMYQAPDSKGHSRQSWLYHELADQWAKLSRGKVKKTVQFAGFYVQQIRPKLRIISLNTNFCYAGNWWLIVNSTDPAGMLKWFVRQLHKAEKENVKVHVIGHISPAYIDCLKVWSKNFFNIISRFEHTVTAQFYGHTHTDEINIFYDSETTKRPVSVGYVGPSISTFINANPAYRIYTIDGDHEGSSYDVHDMETWIMDLEKSNRLRKPIWKKLYSARKAYGMTSLLPEEWDKLYERLKTDDRLLEAYDLHYWKGSPKRPVCKKGCRTGHLFGLRSGIHYGPPNI